MLKVLITLKWDITYPVLTLVSFHMVGLPSQKCPFGAIYKVENKFYDKFWVKKWGLKVNQSVYFVSFTQ